MHLKSECLDSLTADSSDVKYYNWPGYILQMASGSVLYFSSRTNCRWRK